MTESYVYQVHCRSSVNGTWFLLTSDTRGVKPFVNLAAARGAITADAKRRRKWSARAETRPIFEYKIERSPLVWEYVEETTHV